MKLSLVLLLAALSAQAQFVVTVSPPKVTGQKAVVPLLLKNNFGEKIESARAAVFLLDDKGKMVGQATQWVIGGSAGKSGLDAGATNSFFFVVNASRPVTTTNLDSRVIVSRLILEGGKLADPNKSVQVQK